MSSSLSDYNKLKAAIENSSSIKEVIMYVGLRPSGGNYRSAQKWAKYHNLILPVGDPRTSKGSRALGERIVSNDLIFVENSTFTNRTSIKKRLREIWLDWVCSKCGLGELWNEEPLVLQLEHKNGVWNDNRLENLCLLCPNCHSQTETFAGRSLAKPKHYCSCGNVKSKGSKNCFTCAKATYGAKSKIKWPTLEDLQLMVNVNGYSATGRMLGVSDVAVKKHLTQSRVALSTGAAGL